MKTRYQLHVERWGVKGVGCGSELCPRLATSYWLVASCPQTLPTGWRAAGESENLRGRPFIGPAGQLLDDIIERAGLNSISAILDQPGGLYPTRSRGW
jgi:hypothetical protein